MSELRKDKLLKNTLVTTVCQVTYLLTSFIGRTFLTRVLGVEYLGVNGLFNNVLIILSFAELGLGNTLVFRMYEPLAKRDEEKITAYIYLYKKIYAIIIFLIFVMGIIIIPFLKYIVKAPNIHENIIVLYFLYLANTIISYAFVYRKSILIADQKSYVVSIYTLIFNILMNILQCIILCVSHNFILYLLIKIICELLNNICCSYYAKNKYPYIVNKSSYIFKKDEIKDLWQDTKGLFMTKVASTAFGGTDNIFIASYIGIGYVGILSNYTLILSMINTIMNNIFNSITATIGNINITEDIKKTEETLYKLFFINSSIYGYIYLGMALLVREFVTKIWLTTEYDLPLVIILFAIAELFIRSIHFPVYTVRNALGLFSQYRVIFVIAAFLNIILDFLFVNLWGIAGLFVATIICRGITYVTDIRVLYIFGFKKKSTEYYKIFFSFMVYVIILYYVLFYALNYCLFIANINFAAKIVFITIIYIFSFVLLFRKNKYFDVLRQLFMSCISRLVRIFK